MTSNRLYWLCCQPVIVLTVLGLVAIISFCVLFLSSSASALPSSNNLSKSFQNKTLGIDIHYPYNWKVIITECKPAGHGPCFGPTLIRPITNRGNQSVQLEYMFPQVVMQNSSLQEQSLKIINRNNQSGTDLTLIDSKQVTNINGNQTWVIEYIFNPLECKGVGPEAICTPYQEPGSPYEHVIYTLIEKSGKLYEFKYSAEMKDELAFYKNLNIVREIIGSFKPVT